MKIKNKNIVEEVQKFVEDACVRNDKGYAKELILHLSSVAKNAVQLAGKFNADKEVVEIAAWFHDIGTIVYRKEDHHITGAEIAEKKLFELGYPKDKIEKVKHCIFSHRASRNIKRETVEAQILTDADSITHFYKVDDLFEAELVFNNLNKDGDLAKEKVKQKLIRSWNKLSPEGKNFVEIKYPEVLRGIK